MSRPVPRGLGPAILLAAAACSLTTGCAFFQNLDSGGYSQADAGVEASCTPDSGCTSFLIDSCSPCSSPNICCVSLSAAGVTPSCTTLSECSSQKTSVALCNSPADCQDAGSCIPQKCQFGGPPVHVWACEAIPVICTPL